jgi:alpha-tubulin suppressor-like RCC1 family protein
MKSFKKIITLVALSFLLIFTDVYSQKDLVISGGNTVSSFVCNNKKVYAWGSNQGTVGGVTTTGLLGVETTTGSGTLNTSSTMVTSPAAVIFPAGIEINQVSSGSGSHFIALDCNKSVWSWGNNSMGQVGNGSSGQIVTAPTRVKAGVLLGTHWDDGSGNLKNVDIVYAGNDWSFAILDNGALVAWGSNDADSYNGANGALGDGTQVDKLTPVYVKTGTGTNLMGVTQIFAGDNCTYALIDPDGDGIGTVYSWGNGLNGTLGRNAAGTANPASGAAIQDSYARPVYYYDETTFVSTQMNNIKSIYAGDVFGMVLDANGYIWTWGNGGWGNCTGSLPASSVTSIPRRVDKGTTTIPSNDGKYLLAKSIAGGQGYGMAVTKDGKPVAWGGGGVTDGGGFSGGSSAGPEYITYAAGSVHNDVILINRGDTWGFYGRSDGSMWAWGANQYGQLGIGTSSPEVLQAAKINPPSGCGMRDPLPYVDLTPGNTTVCATSFTGLTLNSGFIIGTALAGNYSIQWYLNNAPISGTFGTILIKGTTYTATVPGVYKVVITYTGSNAGCEIYDPAEATMTISAWTPTFTAPTTLTYCGTTATVNVTSTQPKAIYSWYLTSSSNTVIDTTIGSGTSVMDITGATPGSGTDKIVYVEEKSYANGTVLTTAQYGSSTDGDNYLGSTVNQASSFQTGFTIVEPITITELSYFAKTIIPDWIGGVQTTATTPATATVTVVFGIYASKVVGSGLVADGTIELGTLSSVYTRTRGGDPQTLIESSSVKGSVTLAPGTYFIGLKSVSAQPKFQEFKVCRNNSTLPGGIVDDVNGNIIKQNIGVSGYNNPNQGSTGFVYNVKFNTAQHYCTRIPVTLKQLCVCNTPLDVTITSDDSDLTLCPGGSTIITSNIQTNTTMFDFSVYKGTTLVSGPTTGIDKISYTVNYADAGTYKIVVRDKLQPASCSKENTIVIGSALKPTVTLSGGGSFCEGTSVTPVTMTFTGNQPFNYTYLPGSVTGSSTTTTKIIVAPSLVNTYNYSVTSLSDKYCVGDLPTSTATITIKPKPTATVSNDGPKCAGNSIQLTSNPSATGTYSWTTNATTSFTNTTQSPIISNAQTTNSGTYTFNVTVNGCVSDNVTTVVLVKPIPTTPTVTNNGPLCVGSAMNLTSTAPSNVTTPTYSWTGPVAYSIQNPNKTSVALTDGGTYTLIISKDGCNSTPVNTTLIVNDIPVAPIVSDVSYCLNSTATPLTATATGTLKWYDNLYNPLSSAPTPITNSVGVTTYYVSQTNGFCESTKSMIKVTVNANLSPIISASPGFIVCKGTPINLSLNQTFNTQTWTGSNLNSTTISNPVFSGSANDGTYTITVNVTDTKGCTGTDTKTIVVNPIPATPIITSNNPCVGDNLTVSTTSIGTLSWTSPTNWITNETTKTISSNISLGGNYTLTTTINNCTSAIASKTIIINTLPNVSLIPSKTDVCISGNNSNKITMNTTGTLASGTLLYTSATANIDSFTGELNPISNSVGTHTIKLEYSDVNGCKDIVTTTITIHDLPVVTFGTNPTELCYTNAPISLNVNPIGGIFTGTASSSSASFTPSTPGMKNFTYTYTDANSCINSANYSINVIQIDAPTVTAPNPKTAVILSGGGLSNTTEINATRNSVLDILEWDTETMTFLSEGSNTYITNLTDASTPGTYNYITREYRMVNGSKCYSPTKTATIVISQCPALTPIAINPFYCVGESTAITATAIAAPSSVGSKISWLSFDPVGQSGSGKADLLDNNLTYTSSINTSIPTTQTIYVAEYVSANDCWSVGLPVKISVVANPIVTITAPTNVCAVDGNVSFTVNNSTGTLTETSSVGGLNTTTRVWNPLFGTNPNPTKTITVDYKVIETQPDGKQCTTIKSATSTAHFMASPIPVNKTWLISDIDGIPTNFMTATTSGTGTSIKWYNEQSMSNLLSSNLTLDPDRVLLKSEVGTNTTYIKKYWITQTDINGCESEPVEIDLILVDCPFNAPSVTGIEECQNISLSNITATKPVTMSENVDMWKWYSDASTTTTLYTGSSSYSHGVDNTIAQTKTFYVSYVATETLSGNQCESPRTPVSVIVNPNPTIVLNVPTKVCQPIGDVSLSATVNYHTNGIGTETWKVDGTTTGISTTGIFNSKFNGTISGTYSIDYTYIDGKGCENNLSKPINVVFVPAPSTINHLSMTIQNEIVKVEATNLEPSATVNWYYTSTILSNNNPYMTSDPGNIVTNKNYYASQTVNGCESEKTICNVTIIDCPVPAPIVIQPTPICNYDIIPELQASEGTPWLSGPRPIVPVQKFKFYDENNIKLTENSTGKYTPTINLSNAGIYKYYVSEWDSLTPVGCESPKTLITLIVKKTLPPTVIGAVDVCEGENNPILYANDIIGNVEWFETTPIYPANSPISNGSMYTPSFTSAGTHDVWVANRVNGCVSTTVKTSYTIKPIPDAPVTTPNSICKGDINLQVCATGSYITWYRNSNKTLQLVSNSTCYIPTETTDNIYTYYATETVNGCESSTTPVTYTILPLPIAPTITISSSKICDYDSDPIMSVVPTGTATIKWYKDNTYLIGGNTYQVDRINGTTYKASQTLNGCEGPKSTSTFTIVNKPSDPIVTNKSICEGTEQIYIPALSTNMNIDDWFSESDAIISLYKGIYYTPTTFELNNSTTSMTYYIRRTVDGCNSNVIPVTMSVIPKPTFTIGNDTSECARNASIEIQANNFNPSTNMNSIVSWELNKINTPMTISYDDNIDHKIKPITKIDNTILDIDKEYMIHANYYYKDASEIGCWSDTVDIKYTLYKKAKKPVVDISKPICQGTNIEPIQGYGSPQMVWISESGLPTNYGNTYDFIKLGVKSEELIIGEYEFSIFDIVEETGCESDTTLITLTVAPSANTKIIGDTTICVNTLETMYNVESNNLKSDYMWNISGENIIYSKDNASNAVRYVDWVNMGIDTISVYERTWAGCEGFDTLVVKIANYPEPHFTWNMPGASNVVEFLDDTYQQSVIDGDTSFPVTYKMYWNFGKTDNENIIDSIVNYEYRNNSINIGGYLYGPKSPILTVTNDYGCTQKYKEEIFIDINADLHFPNALSPTNPAHGVRYWQPKGYNLSYCEIWVYDTWGNLVWYSNDVKDGMFVGKWDGTYNGEILKSDTYIWKAEATFVDGRSWEGILTKNGTYSKFGPVILIK